MRIHLTAKVVIRTQRQHRFEWSVPIRRRVTGALKSCASTKRDCLVDKTEYSRSLNIDPLVLLDQRRLAEDAAATVAMEETSSIVRGFTSRGGK
jgi:hypothetical protein